MPTQTYDNYYRAYYRKNRKKILARQKQTSSERSKLYYEANRLRILEKKRVQYELKKCQALFLDKPDSSILS